MLKPDPNQQLIEGELERLARSLDQFTARARRPADGYATFEAAQESPERFVLDFNSGLNNLHLEGIGHLLHVEEHFDDLAKKIGTGLVPSAVSRFWTHVSNKLAWTTFELERAYLKQYWSGRKRNLLSHCNPAFVVPALKKEMDSGRLAVWTDSTSFLELGDILSYDSFKRQRTFLEVKGLNVKEAIVVSPDVDPSIIRQLRKDLHVADGQSKADKKVNRLTRQLVRNKQVDRLVANDSGFSPLRGQHIAIIDGPYKDEHYANLLVPEFRKARDEGCALALIDSCLWLGIYYNLDPRLSLAFAGSASAVFASSPEEMTSEHMTATRNEILDYVYASGHPLAQPCFLHDLPDDIITDMITGRVVIRMAFNWKEFAKMIEELGHQFVWQKPEADDLLGKGGLVLTRGVPAIIAESIPMSIGAPMYMRVFSDMIRPAVFALQVVGHLESALAKMKRGGSVHEQGM